MGKRPGGSPPGQLRRSGGGQRPTLRRDRSAQVRLGERKRKADLLEQRRNQPKWFRTHRPRLRPGKRRFVFHSSGQHRDYRNVRPRRFGLPDAFGRQAARLVQRRPERLPTAQPRPALLFRPLRLERGHPRRFNRAFHALPRPASQSRTWHRPNFWRRKPKFKPTA